MSATLCMPYLWPRMSSPHFALLVVFGESDLQHFYRFELLTLVGVLGGKPVLFHGLLVKRIRQRTAFTSATHRIRIRHRCRKGRGVCSVHHSPLTRPSQRV